MSVQSKLTKISVNTKLNNGTKDGKVTTVNVSLGTMNTSTYNDQKAMNIVDLLEPCLAKEVVGVQKVEVSDLTKGE